MSKLMNRRRMLRSTSLGLATVVGLPLLDCFLTTNGDAMAATGAPLPVCFGTWWQGLGLNPGRWIPEKVGAGYEHNVELKQFDKFRDRMNVISGTKYFLDGRPLETHTTGLQIASMGRIPTGVNTVASLDSEIADVIGKTTRFRSIEVALDGGRMSLSKRAGSATNPSDPSPEALYTRIFGPEFKDPNAAEFTPDAGAMARRSVLADVRDERMSLMRELGANDRARLDEYFTALRQIEQQLDIELRKPEPLPACSTSDKPVDVKTGREVAFVEQNIKMFGGLMAHALACGQTRVFNVMVGSLGLRKPGTTQSWHPLTHEEPIDDALGYQKEVTWFIDFMNKGFVEFLTQLDSIKEGAGTVLDRTVVLWQTDHGYARTHTIDSLPIFTVGSGAGRLKTGIHVSAPGDPATRIGLTMQQAMGVSLKSWGGLSNETSKTFTEILA